MQRVPGLFCIAAHFGGYKRWDEARRYLKDGNVYFDTSSTLAIVEKEYAKDLIEHFGARRFFFGVDYPMWDHEEELERFMALDLSDSEREMILYKKLRAYFQMGLRGHSMLTLVLGRAGTGKTTRVIGEIAEIARKSDKPVCLIVPEQFSHTTERQLCETGDAISRTAEVLSFRRLCGRVAAVCGGGARKTLSRGERILLLYKALRRTGPSLKTLCDVSTEPEFITGLLSLIDELKSYNITHEELLDIAKDTHGLLGDKLNDIALIYAAYRSSFGRGEIDSNDELDLLYENIVRCGFFKGKTVYLDGFSGFTVQEYKIIAEIIRTAENVTITLCHDPDADSMEKQIFSKTSRQWRAYQTRTGII